VITRRYIPIVLGLLMLVTIAFLFLSKSFHWTYITETSELEPTQLHLAEPNAEEHITLNIHLSVSEEQFSQLQRLNEEVNLFYPYIHVELTNIPREAVKAQEWMELTALGRLGDIQLIPNQWVLPFAAQGLLQPVDRNMNSEALADQFPSLADALKWNGYLWAVPFSSNPYIKFTHKRLHTKVDIPEEKESSDGKNDLTAQENVESSGVEQQVAPYIEMLEKYSDISASEGISYFINVDLDNVIPLWIWLHTLSSADAELFVASPLLTDAQRDMLHELERQLSLLNTDSLEDEVDAEVNPAVTAYTIIPFDQIEKRLALLEENYVIEAMEIPYPWLNGDSFVISSQSKLGIYAIKWIEKMSELSAKEDGLQGRLAIRPSVFNVYGNSFKYHVKEIFMRKLEEGQIMPAAPEWAVQIEKWNEEWTGKKQLESKIKQLLAHD